MISLTIYVVTLTVIILWYPIRLILWAIRATKWTANIRGPKPLPIIGNALHFANIKDLNDFTEKLAHLFQTYFEQPDRIMKFWLGPKLIILTANPQYIEKILSSQHATTKHLAYAHFRIFGGGQLSANGEKWSEQRKMTSPFLTRKAVEAYLDMFHEKAMKLIKVIDNKFDNDEEFNIKHFTAKCTIDLLLASNYGIDINETENDERPETLEEIFDGGTDRMFKLIVTFPSCLSVWYSKNTSLGKELIKNSKVFWNLMGGVLQNRKQQREINDGNKMLSDMLIEKAERDKLSWDETGKLTVEYLMGGSHSVGIMTSSTILLLAMHPEYQEAVYQEQLEVLGDDPEVAPTWEQLSKMTYLTRVFKEVIRHFTVPIIVRYVDQDLDLGKHKIPGGSSALISLYSLHRDPTIWSHPEEFYPDHFLPEESVKRPKNSYLPFSWGPRNCPGALYAMTAFKILVSTLVRKFYFKTDIKYEDLSYKFSLFLDLKEGHMVKKIPRKL